LSEVLVHVPQAINCLIVVTIHGIKVDLDFSPNSNTRQGQNVNVLLAGKGPSSVPLIHYPPKVRLEVSAKLD
jgi:hypothetical protein